MRQIKSFSIDEEVWKHFEVRAEQENRSVSNYVETLGRKDMELDLFRFDTRLANLVRLIPRLAEKVKSEYDRGALQAYEAALNIVKG